MSDLLTVPEVAAHFGVTGQTVRDWIASGRLRALQPTPRGRYRIRAEALKDLEREAPSARGTSELHRVVSAIAEAVQPDAIYLFGSHARGEATPKSDFDLALIVPDGSARRSIAMRAYDRLASIRGRTVGADLVVLTPTLIDAERDLPGSVVGSVLRDGVLVHGTGV